MHSLTRSAGTFTHTAGSDDCLELISEVMRDRKVKLGRSSWLETVWCGHESIVWARVNRHIDTRNRQNARTRSHTHTNAYEHEHTHTYTNTHTTHTTHAHKHAHHTHHTHTHTDVVATSLVSGDTGSAPPRANHCDIACKIQSSRYHPQDTTISVSPARYNHRDIACKIQPSRFDSDSSANRSMDVDVGSIVRTSRS